MSRRRTYQVGAAMQVQQHGTVGGCRAVPLTGAATDLLGGAGDALVGHRRGRQQADHQALAGHRHRRADQATKQQGQRPAQDGPQHRLFLGRGNQLGSGGCSGYRLSGYRHSRTAPGRGSDNGR